MVEQSEKVIAEANKVETKWKIPPTRVLSDDCVVYVGRVIVDGEIKEQGTAYHVHQGEWVELFPTQTVDEMIALIDMMKLSDVENLKEGGGALRTLCQQLSKRVVAWNWTDNAGESMPSPHDAPEVLAGLTNDELMWLMSAVQGKETSADRKND